ncbi:unnamed protein product, partial [Laminaria digitata]
MPSSIIIDRFEALWLADTFPPSAQALGPQQNNQAMSRSSAAHGGQYYTKYSSSEWIRQAAFVGERMEQARRDMRDYNTKKRFSNNIFQLFPLLSRSIMQKQILEKTFFITPGPLKTILEVKSC